MNCAYQYPQPAHPQNVVTMPPTTAQQAHHPATDTEYLELRRDRKVCAERVVRPFSVPAWPPFCDDILGGPGTTLR
ncbi:hypothetical protein KM043_008247 [Ampulex compressa]|nr:hypothetical protein KM043_008247 [Ampulex compressa]